MKRFAALCLAVLLLFGSLSAASAMTAAGGLTYGDKGDEVLRIQTALSTLGYNVGKIDGSFGAYTENALRKFQKAHGLSVDGIAGSKTRQLLYELAEGTTAAPAPSSSASASSASSSAPSSSASSASSVSTVTVSDGSFFGGNYASIYPGTSGSRVVLLQNALIQLGYSVGKVDGKYGNNTKTAVVSFQRAQHLTADGIAGKKTMQKMESLKSGTSSAAPAAPVIIETVPAAESVSTSSLRADTLALGMKGSEVSELQTQLKTLGYYTGSIDGDFGSGTLNAVTAFQRASGLTADGLAGSKTRSLLSEAVAKAQTATASTSVSTSYRNLKVGMSGEDVTRLQTALKALSYSVNVNGSYDATTKTAVIAFQKQNSLSADGVAGEKTQTKLYSGSAASAPASASSTAASSSSSGSASSSTTVSVSTGGPSKSQIRLLHWFNDIKPTIKSGQTILVYEPTSGISWTLRLYSLGRHADAEPLTADDTAKMVKAFGGQNTWNQKAVYVRLPNGTWTVGSTHDMPHLSGSISNNNFNGHLCVHFLRDMSEAEKNDPKYGVANQKTIRSAWKALTGEELSY